MSNSAPSYIELTKPYTVLSAKALVTGKTVLLDFFSHQPCWLLCLNKSSLSLIKKFQSLNKNKHYASYSLIFSSPSSIKKKLGANFDKTEIFWIEKKFREDVCKIFKIQQIPWVLMMEEGKILYSSFDLPGNLNEINQIEEQELAYDSPKAKRENKKMIAIKEQISVLAKRVKKYEKQEIEYKSEIILLKNTLKNSQIEVSDLKWKMKAEPKTTGYEEIVVKKSHSVANKDSVKKVFHVPRNSGGNDIDIWKYGDDNNEIKELQEITGSRELWINNPENILKVPKIKPNKLFPIYFGERPDKITGGKEVYIKKSSPQPVRIINKRYNF